jgi:hypothetical protein
MAPAACGKNQRSRHKVARRNCPLAISKPANIAPAHAPALFSAQSANEGTRDGKKCCATSRM